MGLSKEERKQMAENQKMLDSMSALAPKDTNTETHGQITTAMDAFSVAEEEQKRKDLLRKKITGQ